ncbi:ABC transporter permease [Ekhidna sp. To15]|uniref:ABC transporter permease n=1 Tax=Ekhidna sp. To15 TaxID=3395267 RepID=UPI003F528AB4
MKIFESLFITTFFKVSFRNLTKRKTTSFISILSLVITLSVAMGIFSHTLKERSWDNYIPNLDNKYRMSFSIMGPNGRNVYSAQSPAPYADLFQSNVSGIKKAVRFTQLSKSLLTNSDNNSIITSKAFLGDSDLLDFFGIELISGTDNFEGTTSVLISRSLANKLFGTTDIVGQNLRFNDAWNFTIIGVFNDFPINSTVSFELIGPLDFMQEIRPNYYRNGENWGGYAFHTYFELNPVVEVAEVIQNFRKVYYDRFEIQDINSLSEYMEFDLMRVKDIHLHSDLSHELSSVNSESRLQLLELLAYLVVLIGYVNFINVQVARAPERLKEIGIRKYLGASNVSIQLLFLLEGIFLNLIALILSLSLNLLMGPWVGNFIFESSAVIEFALSMNFVIIVLVGTIISSFYLSSAIALQSNSSNHLAFFNNKMVNALRDVLLTFQFSVAIFLISFTSIVYLQVDHMSNQDPGFDPSQILIINGPISESADISNKARVLKNKLNKIKGVRYVSSASLALGAGKGSQANLPSYDGPNSQYQSVYMSNITDYFFDVADIEIISGKVPPYGSPTNDPRVVLNRRAVENYGWTPTVALGKKVGYTDTASVVAVVENFNSVGFQEDISPMVFILDDVYRRNTTHNYFLINFTSEATKELIEASESMFSSVFQNEPFSYQFSSDFIKQQYASEEVYSKQFLLLTLLSISIATLGLIGITSYHVIQKRKEIGIRKVLGSGSKEVIKLFSKKYIAIVSMASLISSPIAILFIQAWLQNFHTFIGSSYWYVLSSTAVLLILAYVTVGVIAYRASLMNPISVLNQD